MEKCKPGDKLDEEEMKPEPHDLVHTQPEFKLPQFEQHLQWY